MCLPYYEIKSHRGKIIDQSNSSSIHRSLDIWDLLSQSFIPSTNQPPFYARHSTPSIPNLKANTCQINEACGPRAVSLICLRLQLQRPHNISVPMELTFLLLCADFPFTSIFIYFSPFSSCFNVYVSMNYLHVVKSKIWRRGNWLDI